MSQKNWWKTCQPRESGEWCETLHKKNDIIYELPATKSYSDEKWLRKNKFLRTSLDTDVRQYYWYHFKDFYHF